jgi:uncharacterized protein (TIGR02145 family)
MKTKYFIPAAALALALALALTLSCSSDIELPPPPLPPSSSSGEFSSSSAKLPEGDVYCQVDRVCTSVPAEICLAANGTVVLSCGTSSSSSESQGVQIDGNVFTDLRDGNKYKFETAPNGSIWMSENLNYSRGGTVGYCYETMGATLGSAGANSSGCDSPYGRTYSYAEALALGLCPSGWHLPSVYEWQSIGAGNGSTATGTKVMSSGFYILSGNFNTNVQYPPLGWKERGANGFYWTSNGSYSFVNIYNSGSSFDNPSGSFAFNTQTADVSGDYFSVRCVKDNPSSSSVASSSSRPSSSSSNSGISPSSSAMPSSSSIASSNSSSSIGSSSSVNGSSSSTIAFVECPAYNPETHFCDIRDGKIYKWVKINTQNWMAENLNYAVGGKCGSTLSGGTVGDANTTTCDTYGRLYNWATAMAVCPFGWHLPSYAEWDALMTAVGGSSMAGRHLKATSGWNSNGNGENTYGFSALPGGYGGSGGIFYDVGGYGYWWSSNEDNSGSAYYRYMYYYDGYANGGSYGKDILFSVRCVQD